MIGADDLRLDDRVAIVTGAARGIGRAIALGLGALGADVAVCDRDVEGLDQVTDELDRLGRRSYAGVLDVREEESVEHFVDVARSRLGQLHVLVNNAGGGFAARLLEVGPKGRDALIRENFTSALTCIQAVVPHLADGGSIINITSIEAHRAGPGFAVYSAMKAGLANLTKSLAVELGHRRIRVNCIAPDVISTPGIGDMGIRAPLAVEGVPDHVAGAAAFLASDLAAFVTGTTLHVDGGNLAAAGWHRQHDGSFATTSSLHS